MSKTSQAHIRNPKTPAPPMPNRLVRLISEARWLALVALLVYLALILLTYSKTDPGWSVAAAGTRVGNWGGRVGAYMADLLLYIFGMSA